MEIYYNGKYHKGIYLGEMSHKVLYKGSNLIWNKYNVWDSRVTDVSAYLLYANQVFNTSTDLSSNAMTYFEAEPSTTYKVTLAMDTRFRLFSYNGQPAGGTTITNYAIHALDVNDSTSQNGSIQELSITTGATDTRVWIGYYSNGGTQERLSVRNSIVALKMGGV